MKKVFSVWFFSLFLSFTNAEAKQLSHFTSGLWTGGAYGNDSTGQFTSCIASASYRNDIVMYVLVSGNFDWELGFSSSNWNMEIGERIQLKYRFDNGRWNAATAQVIVNNQVRLPMPADGYIVTRFRRSRTLEIAAGDQKYFFDLSGTSKLLPVLVSCVERNLESQQARSAPATQKGQQGTSGRGDEFFNDAELTLEATRVLSNFLLAANLSEAALVDHKQIQSNISLMHAAAVGPSSMSFALVMPKIEEARTDEFMAIWLRDFSSKCGGKFISGIAQDSISASASKEGFAACQNSDGSADHVQYVLTPRQGNGYYLIGLLSKTTPGNSEAAQKPVTDKLLRDAAYRATR